MRRSALLFGVDNRPTWAFAAFLRDVQVPGRDLIAIDYALQDRFFQKDKITGQPLERWELSEVNVSCPPNQFRRHLAACGFLLSTEPEKKEYLRAAWPGALVVRAGARLADLFGAWKSGVRWNEIVVFGGKRELQGPKENLMTYCFAVHPNAANVYGDGLKKLWRSNEPKTELQMIRFLWEAACLCYADSTGEEMWKLPIIFVDAPMKPPATPGGKEQRPTTEDTIAEWLRMQPTPGSMLVSSGAPYGMAQDEAFQVLLTPHGHTVEMFGHSAPELPVENFMREVAGCVNRIRKARLPS